MIRIVRGIIFRQVKATSGRTMILLFTKEYGKISAGTYLSKNARSRSQLALHPFTYGEYQIFENRGFYNLDKAEVIRSFYGLGDDIDKYLAASYALELTEKAIPEDVPQPGVFDLLIGFLEELEQRKGRPETLLLAYEVRLLAMLGLSPELGACATCGEPPDPTLFSVEEGGVLCRDCYQKIKREGNDRLLFKTKFDIVQVLGYFLRNGLPAFRKIDLQKPQAEELKRILKSYFSYHMEVGRLKSDSVMDMEMEGKHGYHIRKNRTGQGQNRRYV